MRPPGWLLVPMLLALGGCTAPATPPDVVVHDFDFAPQNITVPRGHEVVWRNEGAAGHDVWSLDGAELRSDALGPGDAYRHAFAQPGVYAYQCRPHPWMRGNVTVLA